MNDYISRVMAIALLSKVEVTNKLATMTDAKRVIAEMTAADVAPVVHGRWIDKVEYAACTECGGRSSTQYDGVEPIPLITQFCPNCGAKMQEVE